MWHRVKDLSAEQRTAIESLLGRALTEEEGLNIHPCRVLQDSPTGEERQRAFRQYIGHLDTLSARVKDVPEDELDRAIDEACDYVRHHPQ